MSTSPITSHTAREEKEKRKERKGREKDEGTVNKERGRERKWGREREKRERKRNEKQRRGGGEISGGEKKRQKVKEKINRCRYEKKVYMPYRNIVMINDRNTLQHDKSHNRLQRYAIQITHRRQCNLRRIPKFCVSKASSLPFFRDILLWSQSISRISDWDRGAAEKDGTTLEKR